MQDDAYSTTTASEAQCLRLLTEHNLLGSNPGRIPLRRRRSADTLGKESVPPIDGLGLDASLDLLGALGAVEPGGGAEALLVVGVDEGQDGVDAGGRGRRHGGWVRDGGGVLGDEVGHGHHAGALAGAAGEVVLAVLVVAGLEEGVGDEGGLFAGCLDAVFLERGVEGLGGRGGVGALVGEGGARARGGGRGDGDEVLGRHARSCGFVGGHDAHGAVGGHHGGGSARAVTGRDGDGHGAEGQGAGEEERLEGHFGGLSVGWEFGESLVGVMGV
jgi:hypothetical protein